MKENEDQRMHKTITVNTITNNGEQWKKTGTNGCQEHIKQMTVNNERKRGPTDACGGAGEVGPAAAAEPAELRGAPRPICTVSPVK